MTIYDEVPYPSPPRSSTHPGRFGAPVALMGFPVPPLAGARVLEIGCGEGGNLVSLAVELPETEFHGFDLAPTAIAVGQGEIEALGLRNARLWTDDLLTAEIEGRYDYVIAHGVYAWTPAPVREGLMRLIARTLAPGGLGFVSYNVLPGCHVREIVRDALNAFVEGAESDRARVAGLREAVEAIRPEWTGGDVLQAAALFELERLADRAPEELFHDELAEVYAPHTVADVAAHAGRHGLMYLCDGQGGLLKPLFHPTPAHQRLMARADGDWTRFEQLDDIATLRRFRQSLFRHAGTPPDPALRAGALASLYALGEFKLEEIDSNGVRTFRSALDQTFRTNDEPLCALLDKLTAAFPRALPVAELADGAGLMERVLRLYTATQIGLQTMPSPFTTTPGERPLASPLARRQAARGQREVASLRHISIKLEDDTARRFLTFVDGTRDRTALAEALATLVPDAPSESLRDQVEVGLAGMARSGLLLA